jgi:hypothetical protein
LTKQKNKETAVYSPKYNALQNARLTTQTGTKSLRNREGGGMDITGVTLGVDTIGAVLKRELLAWLGVDLGDDLGLWGGDGGATF